MKHKRNRFNDHNDNETEQDRNSRYEQIKNSNYKPNKYRKRPQDYIEDDDDDWDDGYDSQR